MTLRDILNKMDEKDFIYYGNNYISGVDSVYSCFEDRGYLLDKDIISIETIDLPHFGSLIKVRIAN